MLAVIAHRVFAGHDLIGPMFSGRKPASLLGEHDAIASSRLWLAVVLLAGVAGAVGWLVVPRAGARGIRLRIARLQV